MGHVGAYFRPKWVPEPSWNHFIFEQVNFHEIMCFLYCLHMFFRSKWWPKTTQDVSKIVLDQFLLPLEFSLRFWIVFGSVLVPIWLPKWLPRGARKLAVWPWRASKTVLKSSWFGSLVVLSFGIAFLVVLVSSWGRFWALRGSFVSFSGISTHRFKPSTHQVVDSTHEFINPSIEFINPSTHRFNSSAHQL